MTTGKPSLACMSSINRSHAALAREDAVSPRPPVGPPVGMPVPGPDGVQDPQQAMPLLLGSVMATNLRFAEALLGPAGPGAVVELQRRFVREYFGALAQGGALLLGAARQAAEGPLRLPEGEARERRGDGQRKGAGASKVADVMSRASELASPEDTLQHAARVMEERGTGVLPVGENGRLVGVVTDRDLAVRAVAAGKDPTRTKLREVMSGEPRYVFDDEPLEKAAAALGERQVRRLPVLNRDKRLVGMVSLGDLEREAGGGASK